MAPSVINPPDFPQAVGELTKSGANRIVKDTAPSILSSNGTSTLQELDASKITFTRNPNPRAVPEPGSAEEAGMALFVIYHTLQPLMPLY